MKVEDDKDIYIQRRGVGNPLSMFKLVDNVASLDVQLDSDVKDLRGSVTKLNSDLLDRINTLSNTLSGNLGAAVRRLDGDIGNLQAQDQQMAQSLSSATGRVTKLEQQSATASALSKLAGRVNANVATVTKIVQCNNQGKLYKNGACSDAIGKVDTQTSLKTCNSAYAGRTRYDTGNKVLEFCDGKEWMRVAITFKQGQIATESRPFAGTCSELQATAPHLNNGKYYLRIAGQSGPVYCNMKDGGWTLAMTINGGTSYWWGANVWTSSNTAGSAYVTPKSANQKSWVFNKMPMMDIRLEVPKTGKRVELRCRRSKQTILQRFQYSNGELLDKVGGNVDRPGQLFDNGYNTCCHPWRINSKSYRTNMRQRIGGPITHYWGCGYGNDKSGQCTSASQAGFGMYDGTWAPYTYDRCACGIRHAHDYGSSGQNRKYVGYIYVR